MTLSSCLTDVHVLVVDIAYLADGSHAVDGKLSHFARRKSYECVGVFLTHKLCHIAGAAYELCALAGIKLKVVDESTSL